MTRVYVEAKVEGDKWAGVITDKGVISDSEFFKLVDIIQFIATLRNSEYFTFRINCKTSKRNCCTTWTIYSCLSKPGTWSRYRFFIPPAWPRWEIN